MPVGPRPSLVATAPGAATSRPHRPSGPPRPGQSRPIRLPDPSADVELLEVIAALHNTYSGEAPLPETGYSVRYQGLPLSVDERRTRIEEYRTRSELGIASPVQLLAELEGITDDQARARLGQIRRDRVEFGTI